jgi:heme/copper-type cytochrome/quinol oxidase subunit 1
MGYGELGSLSKPYINANQRQSMTIRLGDTYFVVVHWHPWAIAGAALTVITVGLYWKVRKR